MNSRSNQLYLAHPCPSDPVENGAGGDNYVAEMRPEEAAESIAALLSSLRAIAVQAHFRLLSDLIAVAEEEAKFHYRN